MTRSINIKKRKLCGLKQDLHVHIPVHVQGGIGVFGGRNTKSNKVPGRKRKLKCYFYQ